MTENFDADESTGTDSDDNTFVHSTDVEGNYSDYPTASRLVCDACGAGHYESLETVCLGETEYDVCEDCRSLLKETIERYYWWDRLSKAHYDRAAEFLRSREDVWCVKANWRWLKSWM